MRIIVYTGKGGVGKTSLAAATAVRAAELGHRTLVLSTDLAHSLADSLELPLGPEPTGVAPRLWAQEPDVHHNMQTHWGTIQAWLKAALAWRGGMDRLVAEEVSIIPGMEELSNLLCIDDHRARRVCGFIRISHSYTCNRHAGLEFPHHPVVGGWVY